MKTNTRIKLDPSSVIKELEQLIIDWPSLPPNADYLEDELTIVLQTSIGKTKLTLKMDHNRTAIQNRIDVLKTTCNYLNLHQGGTEAATECRRASNYDWQKTTRNSFSYATFHRFVNDGEIENANNYALNCGVINIPAYVG